jgi:hypothetical protein
MPILSLPLYVADKGLETDLYGLALAFQSEAFFRVTGTGQT